jgi:hypothetical protein
MNRKARLLAGLFFIQNSQTQNALFLSPAARCEIAKDLDARRAINSRVCYSSIGLKKNSRTQRPQSSHKDPQRMPNLTPS